MRQIQEITSLQNPKVKRVVKLRKRRERDQQGLYVIDELREITRAMAARQPLEAVYLCPELGADAKLLDLPDDVAGFQCPRAVFEKMAYRENPDGYLAIARQSPLHLKSLISSDSPLYLVATAIEKPANLGALLRTADGVGADAVLICDPVADLYNPNVLRTSTGAVFSMPTVVVESGEAIQWLKEQGVQIVCTTPDTETLYHEAMYNQPTAVVMGSEAEGLAEVWFAASDRNVRIPMKGISDSLNVSVSAALVLYEALRQRSAEI